MINSDISFKLPVVKLEAEPNLREGKNVVKDFGFGRHLAKSVSFYQ
jgi:hypothetical protein